VIAVDLIVADERWSAAWPGAEAQVEQAVEAALAVAATGSSDPFLELAVRLDGDAAMRELNRLWRGKDRPTNVLSFPSPTGPAGAPRHLGDIILAYDTVEKEADAEAKSLPAHATHLVVHGTLHLLGHDHEDEEAAEAMEALEIEALARLGVADPYQDRAA
jgi:probable rRNA maturation factor